jgi:uncharacterized protein (TIGR02145 family)
MSNKIWFSPIILFAVLILVNSCNKDDDDIITDKDGNIYTSLTIGTQVWMVENLRTTKYNDGTSIPNVIDDAEWGDLNTGALCWYKNNPAVYKDVYGALYNWYAVSTNKLCPTGWHVPSHSEWTSLIDHLGGGLVAGGKLKEIGTTHWLSPNTGATNETGFTALPGSFRRGVDPAFGIINSMGFWWSSSEEDIISAYLQLMSSESAGSTWGTTHKRWGLSIRCIKDKFASSGR